MSIIPVAEWLPDQPPLHGGSAIIQNVLPLTQSSYSPFGSYQQLTPPAGSTASIPGPAPAPITRVYSPESSFLNDVTVYGVDGSTNLFYALVAGAWSTLTEGATLSSYTYTDPYPIFGFSWTMRTNVNNVIASNRLFPLLLLTPSGWTFAASSPSTAPHGQFSANAKGFLMVGNTWDPVGLYGLSRIWWSALNDGTNWPTPGSLTAQQLQSDYNDFPSVNGQVTGFSTALANADVVIFFENGLQRGMYAGAPTVFDFYPIAGASGTIHPESIVEANGVAYYYGRDGFCSTDGITITPIGALKIDQWMSANLTDYIEGPPQPHIVGAYDVNTRCVMWAFWNGAGAPSPSQLLNTVLIYNTITGRWSNASISTFGLLRFWFVAGDSAGETVAVPGIGALGTDYTVGTFTGPALAATVSTAEMQPVVERRAWAGGARPLTDGGAPTVAIYWRNRLFDAQQNTGFVAANENGLCPQRVNARYMMGVVQQPAGAVWNHIEGVDPELEPAGQR